ncbi:MAG: ATP-binding cassette domain-containing protein [Pseudomonadales bacterium]|nr:ATP-binding cassette domain-containing protein [Pseudomonadales bacterium]
MNNRYVHIKPNSTFNIDINFNVNKGLTCIIGDSGAGKTTILRAISGLENHPNSIVAIDSNWQSEKHFTAPYKRKIAYVLQENNLFTHLNVRENINLIKADQSQYTSLKSTLKIGQLENKYPRELSGGEKQRVALFKAFIIDSEIILLDEPLSAVDSHHKKIILNKIQQLKQEINKPIIYVSHNYDEITQIADQIICIQNGSKVFDLPFSSNSLNRYFQKNEPLQIAALFDMKIDTSNPDKDILKLINDDFSIKSTANITDTNLDYRIKILAKDVSICTDKPQNTSILNILEAVISEITKLDQSILITTKIGDSTIFSLISHYSFIHLQLQLEAVIWIQVKALNIN